VSARGGLGVSISSPNHFLKDGLPDLLDHARQIEDLGFSMITVGEHVLVTEEVVRRGIKTWYRPDVIWPDALVLLGALSSVTDRVRLATSIFIAPFRPAGVMAKMAATVDCLSRGRLTLGVGSGWLQPEFEGLGIPFETNVKRMDDAIRACRVLWTQAPASFHSETVNFDNVWCLPQPVQAGGPTVLLAGHPGPRLAQRIAEFADGWIVEGRPGEEEDQEREVLARTIDQVREAFAAVGRDPGTARVQIGAKVRRNAAGEADEEHLYGRIQRHWELGMTQIQVSLADLVRRPEDVRPFLERVAKTMALEPAQLPAAGLEGGALS
jgi:probable F420-dependent oxidoreductase